MSDKISEKPTVSVVMCTYNGEKFLRQQLDSILAQTYPIYEIIIQDNESTDETMSVLQEYANANPIVHVFTQKRFTDIAPNDDPVRQIVNNNFFSAIGRATGDYIAISDQDDIWLNNKIEEQVNAIGDNWCCFHQSPLFSKEPNYSYVDKRSYNYGLERMFFSGVVAGHTMLIRKNLYNKLLKNVPACTLHQVSNVSFYDCIMSCVASSFGKIVFMPKALSYHRIHKENASTCKAVRRDLSERTVMNAIRLVIRNLNPKRRKILIPFVQRRVSGIGALISCFPEAPIQYTQEAYKMVHIYTDKHVCFRYVQMILWAIHNRNRIFYAAEKNQFVATLRAIFLPITVCDAFLVEYEHLTHTC